MAAPTEPQIVEAVKSHLKSDSNSLTESDLPRLLATLELENDWSDITLKRFTSILTKHSILAPNSATASAPSSNPTNTTSSSSKKKKKSKTDARVPKSYIDSSIPYPPGIQGVYFDPVRGKGLISTRPFAEGELLFTEEAYIPTPPPEALDQVTRGELCGQCFLPVSSAPVQLAIKSCKACKYRFCTSACWRSAMATHHNLLCVGLNPGARDLMALVQGHKWQSLHCVARSLARLMSTLTPHNNTPWRSGKGAEEEDLLQIYGDFETVFARLTSFATVSELERRSRNPGWATEKSSFEPLLAQAHSALRLALDPYLDNNTVAHDTSSSPTQVAIENINSTRKNHIKDLFTHPTFLKLLGRANINMEKFGGLYSLHSFLNHSCSPNVQIRHVPSRGILSSMHVAALALRPIAKDEELVISYIDPNTRLGRRQLLLYRDYCFGPCICDKCKDELKQMGLEYDSSKHGVRGFLDSVAKKTGETAEHETNKQNPQEDASLEEELRASLGF